MSTIINATTTNGVVIQPDNSGSLVLQTNSGTTALTIDTSQRAAFVAGTAALPAITTTGDTNTGIFFPAADTIAFSEGGTESMRIDSSGYATSTVNGGGAGLLQSQHYYRLNSGNVGSNATGAQSIFGVGISLLASTQYEFEMVFSLSKTVGTTSHTIALGFGGTATLNNIAYNILENANPAGNTCLTYNISTATSTVLTSAITSATPTYIVTLKGTISVNAAGTFIPQYTLSAAPGGAYTTQIGSYIKISPLAASGANVNVGSWA